MIGIFSGSVVQKINFTCSGGSSSVFNNALKAGCGQHVNFVDDIDLETRSARPHADVRSQAADLVDAPIARAIDLDHVDVFTRRRSPRRHHSRCPVLGRRAGRIIQRFGKNPERCWSCRPHVAPVKRYAWPTRLVSIALVNARPTCSCPTSSSKVRADGSVGRRRRSCHRNHLASRPFHVLPIPVEPSGRRLVSGSVIGCVESLLSRATAPSLARINWHSLGSIGTTLGSIGTRSGSIGTRSDQLALARDQLALSSDQLAGGGRA